MGRVSLSARRGKSSDSGGCRCGAEEDGSEAEDGMEEVAAAVGGDGEGVAVVTGIDNAAAEARRSVDDGSGIGGARSAAALGGGDGIGRADSAGEMGEGGSDFVVIIDMCSVDSSLDNTAVSVPLRSSSAVVLVPFAFEPGIAVNRLIRREMPASSL